MGIILKTIGADFSLTNLGYISRSYYDIVVSSANTSYGTVTGGGTFTYGSSITITATAKSGYVFTNWSDGNTNASRQIVVTGNTTYIALFAAQDTCSSPTCSPSAGTYTSAQSITLSTATSGATIHYTTDGSTPTTNSLIYSGAISINNTTTIRAIAVKSGMTTSSVSTFTFTISQSSSGSGSGSSSGSGSGSGTRTLSINTPTSTDGTAQLSVAVSSGSVPTNLTWSITSGSDYATINSSTGLLTMNWSDTAHNVTVKVVDNSGGLTATKTLSVTKVWHPTQLTAASGFVMFHSSYINSSKSDGPILCAYASNSSSGNTYRDYRFIFVLPNTMLPGDTLSSTTVCKGGVDVSAYQTDDDKKVMSSYSRILIPKGCKTITIQHNDASYYYGLSLNDDYYENSGKNLVDGGWIASGKAVTINVSAYNEGINTTGKKRYLTPNGKNLNGDAISSGYPIIANSGLTITFNY